MFVEDKRQRLMKVAVTAGPGLSVSAPTLVHDFDKLRVRTQIWNVLPDGRFFVGLRNENEDEITRYSLVLNWTELRGLRSGVRHRSSRSGLVLPHRVPREARV